MANQLLHYPLDRGIDQSKDTAASEPPTGLRECTNLWHSRTGVLSTRPGTARLGGLLTADAEQKFAGAGIVENLAIVLAGNEVDGQVRNQDTESPRWFSLNSYAAPVPTYRREVGSTATTARHVAIWRHLLLVAYQEGSDGFIRAYDRTTGAELGLTSLGATGMRGGWASHGDDFAPTLYRWDNGTALRRHVISNTSTGTYGAGEALSAGTITAAILVTGHDDGSAHIVETNATGNVYHFASPSVTGTLVGSVGTGAGSCASYAGRSWFAGIDSGDLYVLTVEGDTAIAVDDTPLSDSQTQVCVVPIATNACNVFSNGSTDVFLNQVGVDGVVGAETLYMQDAYIVGGAVFSELRARAWFRLNRQGASLAFGKFAMVDVSTGDLSKKAVMDSGILLGVPVTSPLFPQASHDGAGSYASSFPASTVGVSGLIYNVFEYRTEATRPIVGIGGHPAIPGGALYDVDANAGEVLHMNAPVILSLTAGTTGSLTTLAAYQFVALFEKRDSYGVIRQGALSEVETVTLTGANDSVAVLLAEDDTLPDGWEVVIFRTEANGTIFYRDSDPLAGIAPGDTFTSTQLDTALAEREILYTEGGVLFNHAAPAHRFAAVGKRRMWLGGLWRPFRLQFSKETLRGEVPAFPDHPTHWLDLERDVTAIAVIDDCVLAFHRDSVDLVTGDGPNIQGTGEFNVRPVTIGAGADDWRSVVVTPIGVFFAGNSTIWLMGRGFGAPENIGALVRDVLDAYPEVVSSQFVDYGHQQCVQFLCRSETAATRLVFSLRSLQWYQWTAPDDAAVLGEIFVEDERRVCLLPTLTPVSSDQLLAEDPDLTTDSGTAFSTVIGTHQIHNWGLATDARIRSVYVRSRVTEAQNWTMELEANGGEETETQAWAPQTKPGYQVNRFGVKRQGVQSIAVQLTAGPVALAGLMLEFDPEGAPKLHTSQKRG